MGRNRPANPVFGRRVRYEREQRGWSLRELARKAGLSASTILRAESGDFDLTLSAAVAVRDALGLPMDKLLEHPACLACFDHPPAGFACNQCGVSA